MIKIWNKAKLTKSCTQFIQNCSNSVQQRRYESQKDDLDGINTVTLPKTEQTYVLQKDS